MRNKEDFGLLIELIIFCRKFAYKELVIYILLFAVLEEKILQGSFFVRVGGGNVFEIRERVSPDTNKTSVF